ncbi:MAG: hypothetical protein U0232_10780 [Thermomicrobiales bacterium]
MGRMVGRGLRGLLAEAGREGSADARTGRVVLGRVRLGSLARVAFRMGWFASLVPSLILSVVLVWVLHGIWQTLDGWDPWTPWDPNTRILGAELPTPKFEPRESLRVEGLYRALGPIGQHPIIAAVLFTVLLTIVGGVVFAFWVTSIGLTYNRYIRTLGGIEFEMVERPARGASRAGRGARGESAEWDDAKLRW